MAIYDLKSLDDWAKCFVSSLDERTIVLLCGPMGVGKTQFIRFCAKALGCEQVCSPSFSIINFYESLDQKNIAHVDLYRLENDDDLESSGFWDLFLQPQGIVFIEWADRLEDVVIAKSWKTKKISMGFVQGEPNQRQILVG